ncbi:Hypothetical protein D9617_29g006910 [Elsinoe fawcettii]|nr:Hypothetical protein D9617_29g006910 [Elsinoe fawcettii]
MPLLSRATAPRLLRMVEGQKHASDAHHEIDQVSTGSSPLSNPPIDLDEEDFARSPEGSSAEEDVIEEVQQLEKITDRTSKSSGIRNIHGSAGARRDNKKNARPQLEESQKTGSKRKLPEPGEEDDQPDWLFTSSQPKRSKTKYGSQSQKSQTSFSKRPSKTTPQKSKKTFKRISREGTSPKSSPPISSPNRPTFRRHVAAPPGNTTNDQPLSSPLSHPQLSSPLGSPIASPPPDEIEEIYLDVPNPADFSPCPICSAPVSKSWRIDWELEHLRGRRMNLRMQEKFCEAHKEQSAAETWKNAQYPEVDWKTLPKRLAKQKGKIEDILVGKRETIFRAELEERVKSKESKTVAKSIEAGGERGKTGYYGTKGAKIMMEWALKTFSTKLRRAAGEDRLMTSSGVAGGISGYVQAVIVPELALGLIMEDMELDETKAKKILAESEEIGDLLNAEEEEKIVTKIATPPPTYGAD